MIIRNNEQLSAMSPREAEDWRLHTLTAISHLLADRFNAQEIAIAKPIGTAIVRAAYKPDDMRWMEESAASSVQMQVALSMAEHLRYSCLNVELVHMDGRYDTIFDIALHLRQVKGDE